MPGSPPLPAGAHDLRHTHIMYMLKSAEFTDVTNHSGIQLPCSDKVLEIIQDLWEETPIIWGKRIKINVVTTGRQTFSI
jgi:hypothetical protein